MDWHHDEGILTWIDFKAPPESEQWEVRFFLTSLSTNPSSISNPHTPTPSRHLHYHSLFNTRNTRLINEGWAPTKLSHLLTFLQSRLSCERFGLRFDWVHWAASIWVGPDKREPPLCFPLSFYCTLKMNRGEFLPEQLGLRALSEIKQGCWLDGHCGIRPISSWVMNLSLPPLLFSTKLYSLFLGLRCLSTQTLLAAAKWFTFPPFASVGLSLGR